MKHREQQQYLFLVIFRGVYRKQKKSCVLIQSAWLVMAEFQQRMTDSESIFMFTAAGFQSAAVINSSPVDRVPGYRYFGSCFLLSWHVDIYLGLYLSLWKKISFLFHQFCVCVLLFLLLFFFYSRRNWRTQLQLEMKHRPPHGTELCFEVARPPW